MRPAHALVYGTLTGLMQEARSQAFVPDIFRLGPPTWLAKWATPRLRCRSVEATLSTALRVSMTADRIEIATEVKTG